MKSNTLNELIAHLKTMTPEQLEYFRYLMEAMFPETK